MSLKTTPVANWTNHQWKHYRSACAAAEQDEIQATQGLSDDDMIRHYLVWMDTVDPAWLRPGIPPGGERL